MVRNVANVAPKNVPDPDHEDAELDGEWVEEGGHVEEAGRHLRLLDAVVAPADYAVKARHARAVGE